MSANQKCSVYGCKKRLKCAKYCHMHGTRLSRTGRLDIKSTKEKLYERTIPEPNTGCLLYIKYTNKHGYGRLRYKKQKWLAHRLSWFFTNGEIPEDLLVLHKCDTPSCINPKHLYVGTQKDNAQDMANRGRCWKQNLKKY